MSEPAGPPIRIGISSCLLGEKVRYDGGHKRDAYLDEGSRGELHSLLEDYRRGLVPLILPLTLVRHYVRRFQISYLRGQTYLDPHPKELMLRNHV